MCACNAIGARGCRGRRRRRSQISRVHTYGRTDVPRGRKARFSDVKTMDGLAFGGGGRRRKGRGADLYFFFHLCAFFSPPPSRPSCVCVWKKHCASRERGGPPTQKVFLFFSLSPTPFSLFLFFWLASHGGIGRGEEKGDRGKGRKERVALAPRSYVGGDVIGLGGWSGGHQKKADAVTKGPRSTHPCTYHTRFVYVKGLCL